MCSARLPLHWACSTSILVSPYVTIFQVWRPLESPYSFQRHWPWVHDGAWYHRGSTMAPCVVPPWIHIVSIMDPCIVTPWVHDGSMMDPCMVPPWWRVHDGFMHSTAMDPRWTDYIFLRLFRVFYNGSLSFVYVVPLSLLILSTWVASVVLILSTWVASVVMEVNWLK